MKHIVDEYGQGFLTILPCAIIMSWCIGFLREEGQIYRMVIVFMSRICGD